MDILLIILGFVVGVGIYILGRCRGKKIGQHNGYFSGRMAGWKSCETLIINRMINSKHLDLNEREILDEFIR